MSEIPEDIIAAAREHIAKGEMAIATVVNAILAERLRCAEAAKATGNFGDYRRDELTADYGQPRFDMMHSIIFAITSPNSLRTVQPLAAKPHGVPPSSPCGTPNPAGEP